MIPRGEGITSAGCPGSRPSRCSFTARHETEDEACAQRTLDRLEDLRLRLEDRFDDAPGGITVIVHPSPGWLAAAHPFLPGARLAAAPAGRRYLAGWAMASELHILNDEYTDRRAAGEDSLAALRGTAERLYAQIVLAANNDRLPPPWGPRRFCALHPLGLADRGRRPVLRRPDLALSRRGQHPHAPGPRAVVPALGPRRDHPRRDRLRPARERARPRRLPDPGLAAAARGCHSARSSSPSTRASATSSASGAATCARTCRGPARSASCRTKRRSDPPWTGQVTG